MKIFVHMLIIMATVALGSVALAEDEVTGPVVAAKGRNITVQATDGSFDFDLTNYKGRQPKVGDRVTIWRHRHVITKLEIKGAAGSNK